MPNANNEITALVLTYNGERLIDKCINSLKFCGRILVVDSVSKDDTVQICRNLGAEVIENPWPGPGAQFKFAFEHIKTPWVFCLDQDEVCTDKLRGQIEEALRNPASDSLAGYFVRRKSWYYNRFMKHSGWYPDYLLRLFRPSQMRVEVSGAHYSFIPEIAARKLDGEILHYPYRDFSEHLEKINSYASQGAASLAAKARRGGLLPAVGHGLGRFVKIYFIKAGIFDGKAGFINAVHGAFYAFCKYLRVEKQPWGAPYDHH